MYHVGLPGLKINAAINAPPEVVLRLSFPGKYRESCGFREREYELVSETRGSESKCVKYDVGGEADLTSLSQCSSHFVLGGVDVTGGPPALSTQCRQSFHQHLRGEQTHLQPVSTVCV